VALYRCNPLPHIVAVIPVPEIASKVDFKSPNIPPDDTCSSAVEDVASGRTAAILALDIIVCTFLTFTVVVIPFSDVYW